MINRMLGRLREMEMPKEWKANTIKRIIFWGGITMQDKYDEILNHVLDNPGLRIKEIAYDCEVTTEEVASVLDNEGINLQEIFEMQEGIGEILMSRLVETVDKIVEVYKNNYKEIDTYNYADQDHLHALEDHPEDYADEDKVEFYDSFRQTRLERRLRKNMNVILKPAYEYFNNNDKLLRDLNKILGKTTDKHNYIKNNAEYHPRVHHELFPESRQPRTEQWKDRLEKHNAS